MKVAVLTTQTPHHAYFVRELAAAFPVASVVLETNALKAPFDTAHELEQRRDEYERQVFFGGRDPSIADLAPTRSFPSVNDEACLDHLRGLAADVLVVFGTGIIRPGLIAVNPRGIVNLHGGDPREYRGLDSHLWAIYHGDWENLVTTLHRVNPALDDGETVLMARVPVARGMQLHQLRRSNAEVCVRLVVSALAMRERLGGFVSTPQGKRGRYYSFMPAPLKEICRRKFDAWAAKLPAEGAP